MSTIASKILLEKIKMEKKIFAVIVAGGSGMRMGSEIPKQFILLNGLPILMHTISLFKRYNSDIQIIVVLPDAQISYWKDLCEKYQFNIQHQIEIGGETRFHSVQNGLELVTSPSLVAIHDGVRPFVSFDALDRLFEIALKNDNAIPVVDVVESIRKIEKNNSIMVNRSDYRLVQTPQVFDADLILKAYEQSFNQEFTDDASVVEKMGVKINLVEGNRENIKITTPFDLIIGEALQKKNG